MDPPSTGRRDGSPPGPASPLHSRHALSNDPQPLDLLHLNLRRSSLVQEVDGLPLSSREGAVHPVVVSTAGGSSSPGTPHRQRRLTSSPRAGFSPLSGPPRLPSPPSCLLDGSADPSSRHTSVARQPPSFNFFGSGLGATSVPPTSLTRALSAQLPETRTPLSVEPSKVDSSIIASLVEGFREWKNLHVATHLDFFEKLPDDQHPRAAMIACSDSRVHPVSMFKVRRAGAILRLLFALLQILAHHILLLFTVVSSSLQNLPKLSPLFLFPAGR